MPLLPLPLSPSLSASICLSLSPSLSLPILSVLPLLLLLLLLALLALFPFTTFATLESEREKKRQKCAKWACRATCSLQPAPKLAARPSSRRHRGRLQRKAPSPYTLPQEARRRCLCLLIASPWSSHPCRADSPSTGRDSSVCPFSPAALSLRLWQQASLASCRFYRRHWIPCTMFTSVYIRLST